jgi:glycosyltransferase involved in cell wall biosynthesis
MAPVEAMACGLPLISFDLSKLRVLHPKGVVRIPCYDLNAFAEGIIRLLEDEKSYARIREEALEFAAEWDWDKRANMLIRTIKESIVYQDELR